MQAHVSGSRKRDRSTVPCIAGIVACVLFAYGLSSESALSRWILPGAVALAGLAYGLLPDRLLKPFVRS